MKDNYNKLADLNNFDPQNVSSINDYLSLENYIHSISLFF